MIELIIFVFIVMGLVVTVNFVTRTISKHDAKLGDIVGEYLAIFIVMFGGIIVALAAHFL